MVKSNLILMADIVGSRALNQAKTMTDFETVVELVNKVQKANILSPLTITLGDEFQSVIKDLRSAIEIIFYLEEGLLILNAKFKLRYVLYEGTIDTPINPEIAYGMMGDGLTRAREALISIKSEAKRFKFNLAKINQGEALNNMLFIYQKLVDRWKYKDYELISNFVAFEDYKTVAKELDKNRSLMWKRKKALRIAEYIKMKSVLYYLAGNIE